MQANELRIGNWVNHFGVPSQIQTGAQIDKNIEDLKPIKLTEEWLLKFGFDGDSRNGIGGWVKYFLYVEQKYGPDFTILFENKWGDEHEMVIQYVHQLQNLYFALTGKELEVKTPAPSQPLPGQSQLK